MGIRAYKIELNEPTFSWSADSKLKTFVEDHANIDDGTDFTLIEIKAKTLREMVAKAEELELTDEQGARFKADVSGLADDDEILYLCR